MKTRKVRPSPEAIEDVRLHVNYFLGHADKAVAHRFIDAVQSAYDLLAFMPNIGAPRDFGLEKLKGMRMWPIRKFPKYLIFYTPTKSEIRIERILHGARNIAQIFNPDND